MILIAPTAFKGTLSAAAAAGAMADGVRAHVRETVVTRPLSDGGPGLIDALRTPGDLLTTYTVPGPLGEPTDARILWRDTTAVLESADACGLHLVMQAQRDPLRADSAGVGVLLRAAADAGAAHIVLGLGGSATVDAGYGMTRALGWRWLDLGARPLPPGGGALIDLARLHAPEPDWTTPLTVLADVRTPLSGPNNAAVVFGPQKGATPEVVKQLERGLARFAEVASGHYGRGVALMEGGGAAGGLGAAAVALLGGQLVPGSAWVLKHIAFDELLGQARLLVTGEGAFDAQSALGKITGEVIKRARARPLPVLLIAGRVEGELPPGVLALDGEGTELDAADLSRLAHEGVRRLLPS